MSIIFTIICYRLPNNLLMCMRLPYLVKWPYSPLSQVLSKNQDHLVYHLTETNRALPAACHNNKVRGKDKLSRRSHECLLYTHHYKHGTFWLTWTCNTWNLLQFLVTKVCIQAQCIYDFRKEILIRFLDDLRKCTLQSHSNCSIKIQNSKMQRENLQITKCRQMTRKEYKLGNCILST